MTKNHQNKNDRKRQRRKDFQHGRDWQTAPQDQRSSYPKSSVAQRADADRRAQIAGVRTQLPATTWRTINVGVDIDLSPGAINMITPSPKLAHLQRLMQDMNDDVMQQILYGVSPVVQGMRFVGVVDELSPRPDLHREMQVGEILAYRCWRLIGNQLHSVYMHDDWNPGQIMVGRGIDDWSERGVHAWKDLNSEKFNDYVRGYLSAREDPFFGGRATSNTIIVTGTVLLWGDVVEHEHGYRAEFARINSIDWLYPDATLMGRERETLAHLRSLYGVA